MAALRAGCPSCGATLKITDLSLAGTTIDCPKCGEAMVLPEAESEEVEHPAKKRHEEEDRPRPKKSKKRAAASSSSKVPLLIGGALLLVVVGVAVYFATRPKNEEVAGGNTKAPPPPPPGVMDGRGGPGDGGPRVANAPKEGDGQPAPKARPGEKLFAYDVAKLGYDPAKPDHVIPALQWPRRASRDDQSLAAYNDKIIVTEGRIYGFSGTESSETPGVFTGPLRVSFYLFDAGGQISGADGRGVGVGAHLPPGTEWKSFRPGQVVKVAGRARTPKDAPTSLSLSNAVVLSVTGDGDPPMTTDQYAAAVKQDFKKYAGGFTSDQYVTLNATVTSASTGKYPTLTLACQTTKVTCQIANTADLAANPPKPGDSVTLIVHAQTGGEGTIVLGCRGLYVPQ